jgi:hypothetical protein
MNIYYVYAYLRTSDNTPYYIGKGKGKRAFSKYHSVSVPNDKSKIVFLETNLTNLGACALERRYIRWYGRKINNTGILYNITEGGEGNTSPRSEEWKRNHSQKIKGNKLSKKEINRLKTMDRSYMKTESYRKKMSESQLKRNNENYKKEGYHIMTPFGCFTSVNQAHIKLNISRHNITNWAEKQLNGYFFIK